MSSSQNDEDNDKNIEAETSFDVQLYIYDMSKGLLKQFSPMFLGKEIEGLWHTSIVAHGREYFFGGMGIESCDPGITMLGEPDQIIQLGKTEIPYSLFLEYILSLGESTFSGGRYNLMEHNCNNFTDELATFLTGRGIPPEILALPSEVLNSPLGPLINSFLSSVPIRPAGTGISIGSPQILPTNQRVVAPTVAEPTQESQARSNTTMADTEAAAPETPVAKKTPSAEPPVNGHAKGEENGVTDDDKPERKTKFEPRKTYKYEDPPHLFTDVDGENAMKKLRELVQDLLDPAQQQQLKEWYDYLATDDGAWLIGDEHLDLLSLLLTNDESGKFAPNVSLLMLQALEAAALKEDFVLILHQDRTNRRLMTYINRIESLTLAEQEEIAKLLCNLCSQPSSFDWLMYITEWIDADGVPTNNARVTTRAAVHTLLNDQLTTLQKTGVSLIFNLALKELFDDTATELATAILQFIHGNLPEDQVFECLTSLLRFMVISSTEVPALTKMLGPDMAKFKGVSDRIEPIVAEIEAKVAAALAKSGANYD